MLLINMAENENDFIQKFGYTEMYEWSHPEAIKNKLGIFVQFDKDHPEMITPANKGNIIGVSTINSLSVSDDPKDWKYANICNEVGDLYLQKEKLAVGQKVYDEVLEFNYIVTRPWEHYITVKNKNYRPNEKYIPRSARAEWVKVNLIGKCIVRDNGECVPGSYCKTYNGKLKELWGTAVPAEKDFKGQKFYVMQRLSDSTILILFR